MNTNLQSSGFQKQHDLQFDLVTELLKLDDDATALDASVRAKLTELKQLSIELQRKPFEETVDAADTGGIDWGVIARKAIEAGVEYAKGWFEPGQQAALYNDTNSVITVLTYDQRDFLRWVPYGRYTIAPRMPGVIFARGNTTFQADIRGKVYNVRIGGQHVFNGTTVIGR